MEKTLVRITAQCRENYGDTKAPHWKDKGSQEFTLMAEDEWFMYDKERAVQAIKVLLAKESNPKFKYEYYCHDLVFHTPKALNADLFEVMMNTELATSFATLHFQDHGQDFLQWNVAEDGQVLESHPFQGSVWTKYRVTNLEVLKDGVTNVVRIQKGKAKPFPIKYPVTFLQIQKPDGTYLQYTYNAKLNVMEITK